MLLFVTRKRTDNKEFVIAQNIAIIDKTIRIIWIIAWWIIAKQVSHDDADAGLCTWHKCFFCATVFLRADVLMNARTRETNNTQQITCFVRVNFSQHKVDASLTKCLHCLVVRMCMKNKSWSNILQKKSSCALAPWGSADTSSMTCRLANVHSQIF